MTALCKGGCGESPGPRSKGRASVWCPACWAARKWCEECCRNHDAYERRAYLRLRAHLCVRELQRMYPCRWPRTNAGERKLFRDLRAVRGPTDKRPIPPARVIAEALAGRSATSISRLYRADSHRVLSILHGAGLRYVGGRVHRWFPPSAARSA
jgi:hypothetical protein